MKPRVAFLYFAHSPRTGYNLQNGRVNIPSLHAALESAQNKLTHSPLVETTALCSDSHEFNFHAEGQRF